MFCKIRGCIESVSWRLSLHRPIEVQTGFSSQETSAELRVTSLICDDYHAFLVKDPIQEHIFRQSLWVGCLRPLSHSLGLRPAVRTQEYIAE